MCYIASIFHVLTHFQDATLMLQTFQTTIKEFLGRGSILSDVVGVDGLTYLPSLPLLSYKMALSHIYCNKFSFETFVVTSV